LGIDIFENGDRILCIIEKEYEMTGKNGQIVIDAFFFGKKSRYLNYDDLLFRCFALGLTSSQAKNAIDRLVKSGILVNHGLNKIECVKVGL